MSSSDTTEQTPIATLRIDVADTVTRLPDSSCRGLHDGVDGWIEALPGDGSYLIWVNEERKIRDLPRNPLGEILWFLIDTYGCLAAGDWMAGRCVITGPIGPTGDPESVDDRLALAVHLKAAAVRRHRDADDSVGPTS